MPAVAVKARRSPPRKAAPQRAAAPAAADPFETEESDAEYAARHPIEAAIDAKKKREGRFGYTDEELAAVMKERGENARPDDWIRVTPEVIERLRKSWSPR